MDRVADFESVGWGFESLTACQRKPLQFQRLLGFYFATKSINHPISHSLFTFKTTNKRSLHLLPSFLQRYLIICDRIFSYIRAKRQTIMFASAMNTSRISLLFPHQCAFLISILRLYLIPPCVLLP